MMISPETFYDRELAGKSTRDIKKVINDLKQEMKQLVDIMEIPDYRPMMRPVIPRVQILPPQPVKKA